MIATVFQYFSRWLRHGCIVLLAMGLIGTVLFACLRDNIHCVIPDQVFRSAQLSTWRLQHLIEHKHLQSIVNLRGSNPQDLWYQQEFALAKQFHLHFYNIPMKAYHAPSPLLLQQLVQILVNAPRPILIHCKGGSDRTGLAAAIILLLNNASLKQAQQQVSLRYFAFSEDSVGKLVLPFYGDWLQQHHWQSNRQRFLMWVNDVHLYALK